MAPSYDLELNLLFTGTSVTSPAPKFMVGGADNLQPVPFTGETACAVGRLHPFRPPGRQRDGQGLLPRRPADRHPQPACATPDASSSYGSNVVVASPGRARLSLNCTYASRNYRA